MKSGIVEIVHKNNVLYRACSGYSHIPSKSKNNKDTSFPLASGGKSYVAVGIMKTIEEGLLSLETKIKDIVSFPLNNVDGDVTIYQLLTHTSGVPDYCDEEKWPDYEMLWKDFPNYKIRTSKDLLPLFIDEPMKYQKGTRFEYNNSGYVLLGLVLEETHGVPFDEYLKREIFTPIGMNHTGYYELDRLPYNTALGYISKQNQEPYSFIYSIDAKGTGAGGAFSSARDISLFFQALHNHTILMKESVDLLWQPHVSLEHGAYGFGFWLDNNNNPAMIGEDPGATFMSRYIQEKAISVTAISNMAEDVYKMVRMYQDKIEAGEAIE